MELDAILAYMKCPMIYKYRYIENLWLLTDQEAYTKSMLDVLDRIHTTRMDRSDIKYAWGEAFDLNIAPSDIMWMPRSTRRTLMVKGLKNLLKVYDYIAISKFKVQTMEDINLNDITIKPRYVYKKGRTLILQRYIDNDYEASMICTAYPIVKVINYDMGKGSATTSQVNKSLANNVMDSALTVKHLIEDGVIYTKFALDECKTCLYNKYCRR